MKTKLITWFACLLLGIGAVFAEDAYIESTGTQAINTGYVVKPTSKFEIDFQLKSVVAQNRIFGDKVSGDMATELYLTGGTEIRFGYGNTYQNPAIGVWGDTNRHTATIDFPNRTWAYDDKGGSLASTTFSGSNAGPLILFSRATDGSGSIDTSHNATMRLYSFRIYESGTLVRDYVPCQREGVYGLYDKIGKAFVANYQPGGGAGFSAGGDGIMVLTDNDPYIESDGVGGMNSRHFFGPNTKFEIDFKLLKTDVQQRIAGVDAQAAGTYGHLYVDGGGNFRFYVGDGGGISRATGYPADLVRHTAVLDRPGNVGYLITDGAVHGRVTLGSADGGQTTVVSSMPMALFGGGKVANGLSEPGSPAKVRIYGARFYENGKLVHDYRPLKKGGVAGFVDKVDGAFITGETVSHFSAGGDIETIADDGYVSMIGSDGSYASRYFDTKYMITPQTRVEFDYAMQSEFASANWYLGSAYGVSGTDHERFLARFDGKTLKFQLGKGAWFTQDVATDNRNVRHTAILDALNSRASLVTAGFTNLSYQTTYDGVGFSGKSLKIGAIWDGGSGYPPLKFYSIKIYESNVLKHSYEPRVKDGVTVLYDTVGQAVLPVTYNKASTLTYPKRLILTPGGTIASDTGCDDAYVESDGTQAINTGYKPKATSRFELDFQYVDVIGQSRAFGENVSGNLVAELYVGGSEGAVGAGGSYIYGNPSAGTYNIIQDMDCQRRTAILDFANRTYALGNMSGTLEASAGISGESSVPLILFARAIDASGGVAQKSKIRVYSFSIYENGELVHRYLPYKDGNVVGLKDVKTGGIFEDICSSSTSFKVGGRGWGADHAAFYDQPKDCSVPFEGTKTISTYAPSALSYQWYKNGEPIDGATGSSLTISWEKLKAPHTVDYTVKAKFDRYGVIVESESDPATVTMSSPGLFIVVK